MSIELVIRFDYGRVLPWIQWMGGGVSARLAPPGRPARARRERDPAPAQRDGLVLRYPADDGLPPGEGAFLPCSFWLVDALVLLGRRDEAVALVERLLALADDVGLLAEEHDPSAGRLVGSFPEAFSHIRLVNGGLLLSREEPEAPAGERAQAGHGSCAR